LAVFALLALISLGIALSVTHVWASHQLRSARAALDLGHDEEAADHAKACLRFWPTNADALWVCARAARRRERFDLARDFLDRYEAIHGSDDRLALERLLLRIERDDVEGATALCQEMAVRNHPDAPLVLEAMVRALLRNFRLGEADFWLKKWETLQPDNARAACCRGELAQFAQRHKDALASYTRALQLDPEYDDARMLRAEVLIHMRQGSEARSDLERLRLRRPNDPGVVVRLAQCYDQLGQPDKARAQLAEALARWPDYAQALAERGRMALDAKEFEEAEPLLRKALERVPGDYSTRFRLKQCLEQLGKHEEAARQQDRLDQADKDHKRLEEILMHELQRRPTDAALHFEMAQIRFRAGEIDESLRWLKSTLKLDPGHKAAHLAIAGYYRRAGNEAQATEHERLAGPQPAPRP
jgi:tetratricopeptide (TPR) repeat protein